MAAISINEAGFRELVQEGGPVLAEFWAPWCSYCRRIAPVYDKVAEQYQDCLSVAKINIDENGALAEKEHIEVIPTLVLYRDGKAVASLVAPESKTKIDRFLQEHL